MELLLINKEKIGKSKRKGQKRQTVKSQRGNVMANQHMKGCSDSPDRETTPHSTARAAPDRLEVHAGAALLEGTRLGLCKPRTQRKCLTAGHANHACGRDSPWSRREMWTRAAGAACTSGVEGNCWSITGWMGRKMRGGRARILNCTQKPKPDRYTEERSAKGAVRSTLRPTVHVASRS